MKRTARSETDVRFSEAPPVFGRCDYRSEIAETARDLMVSRRRRLTFLLKISDETGECELNSEKK
jgi:hypothetical protein